MPQISAVWRKRVAGALLLALGAFALAAPVAAGRWSLAILGIPLIALSLAEAYATFTSPRRAEVIVYLPSLLALFAGNLLLLSSALVVSGLLILLIAILLVDGLGKMLTGWRGPRSVRVATLANGLVDLGCAALLWYLNRVIDAELTIGIVVGAYIAAAGWRILMAPVEPATTGSAGMVVRTTPSRTSRR
jgi:hypothetical protein